MRVNSAMLGENTRVFSKGMADTARAAMGLEGTANR